MQAVLPGDPCETQRGFLLAAFAAAGVTGILVELSGSVQSVDLSGVAHRALEAMRGITKTIRMVLVLAIVAWVGSCSSSADGDKVSCIRLKTTNGAEVFGVPYRYLKDEEYKRGGDLGSFTVFVRYADLSAPAVPLTSFDPNDLKRPQWSIRTTNAVGRVMIDTVGNGTWPLISPRKDTKWDLPTDFPGWREIKLCPGCTVVNYFPESGNSDIDYIACSPPLTPPTGHACQVWARGGGANLSVDIPLLKLKDYRLFLSQVSLLMQRFRDVGRKACPL